MNQCAGCSGNCAACGMTFTRRGLLAGAALGAAGLLGCGTLGKKPAILDEAAGLAPLPPYPKVRLHVVYCGGAAAWPRPDLDEKAELEKYRNHLAGLIARYPDVELIGGEHVRRSAQAVEAVRQAGGDGVLLIHLGWSGDLTGILDAGKPVAIFSQPFSGHEWILVSEQRRLGKQVALLASRDWGEIDLALRLLKAQAQMRRSRMVLVSKQAGERAQTIAGKFGCQIEEVTTAQAVAAHGAADEALARRLAQDLFLGPAKRIIEPTPEEVIKSTKMYLAMRRMLAERQAQAITVNCLGGIPIQVLGYPCLGFAQLCDEGYPGACEADLDSTLTMMLFQYAFGKPGFITDPLFDLSKNAVIHAHCVAPTRMDGAGGKRHPFTIRTHRDDNKGASLDVTLRHGEKITCAKVINDDALLVSTGTIVEGRVAAFDDRGCRTQITTVVDGSAQKMLDGWSKDMTQDRGLRALLHRVVFYGDHTRGVEQLASLMGLKVIPEC